MKISICIPSYNKKDTIKNAIESVVQNMLDARQPEYAMEFVIIDDCSSDSSFQFLQTLRSRYSFRLIQNKTNKGLVKNWNECIKKATGNFILILHADDILAPGILLRYIQYLSCHPDCAFIHANAIDVTLPYFSTRLRVTQRYEMLKKGDQALEKIILDNNLACSTVMVARKCYDELGVFDESCWVSPDWEMWARIGQFYDIHHVSVVGAFIILNQNNTHTSGIPLAVFKTQQQYYIEKICGYVHSGIKQRMMRKCELQLDNTLCGLGIQYIRYKKIRLGLRYIFSTNNNVIIKIGCIASGLKSLMASEVKKAFYPKKKPEEIARFIENASGKM